MTASTRYRKLKRELAKLRRGLLPKKFKISGDYPPEIFTRTAAYRVLAHAEIESYLEDRAYETALSAIREWEQKQKLSKILLGLLAFSGQKMEEPPDSLSPDQSSQASIWDGKIRMSNKITSAMNAFTYAVINNHGIKEKNVLRLLLPIGIEAEELDPLLLTDLNSFAKLRGEAAHLSAAKYRAKQQMNPKDELRTVMSLVDRLIEIDTFISQLLA